MVTLNFEKREKNLKGRQLRNKGKGIVRKEGADITIVAVSLMVREALKAAENLAKEGIDAECIDLRSVKPIDKDIILQSVSKTGRLVIADVGWQSFGVSAEIAAMVAQHGFQFLKAPVLRVALPDCPAPASKTLEEAYYPTAIDIAYTVQKVLSFS